MKPTVLHRGVCRALDGWGVPGPGETVVVALSGGADSVALLDSLLEAGRARGFRVRAAHLDHGLRAVSADEAAFCAALCQRLGVPLETGRADVRARVRDDGGGLEEAARVERYAFLRDVKARAGAGWLALAHTRDDQAETLLLRLLRGSGLLGLGAMRARSGDVLRPLLRLARADVLAHLRARGLAWCEDESNADLALQRNRVRHELLPYLEARFNPEARAVLARTAELLGDDEDALSAQVEAAYARLARPADTAVALDAEALASLPAGLGRGVVRQALRATGGLRGVASVHVERLLALAGSPHRSGRRLSLPGERIAHGRFGELHVGPRALAGEPFAVLLRVPGQVALPDGGALVAQAGSGPAVSQERMAVVSVPAEPPLAVRTRLPGDRVRAKGREMSLKRFLMERRVPADERARLALVASGSDVLWVPGQPSEAPPARPYARFVRLEWQGAA